MPIRRDPWWPAAQAGTALIIERSDVEIFTGQDFRIDVSSEAGSRFDQNITGFRAEEEFGDGRIIACMQAHLHLEPAAILEKLLAAVSEFSAGTVQRDDITALVLRYSGPKAR